MGASTCCTCKHMLYRCRGNTGVANLREVHIHPLGSHTWTIIGARSQASLRVGVSETRLGGGLGRRALTNRRGAEWKD